MHDDSHDGGFSKDLRALTRAMARRQLLGWAAGTGLVAAVGCSGDELGSGGDGNEACSLTPEETAGPYPGDGSNGPNALALEGITRSDIRTSVGGASGTAAGIPLKVELTIAASDDDCASLAGYAVYLWHCDRDGNYSMYSAAVVDENYLRGVQASDDDGTVTFTTTFPGCYSGRWPHIHFEVYASVEDAVGGGDPLLTSQLAFPADVCAEAYETAGYEASVTNLAGTSLESDNVFGDGVDAQLADVTGSAADGYTATLLVGV